MKGRFSGIESEKVGDPLVDPRNVYGRQSWNVILDLREDPGCLRLGCCAARPALMVEISHSCDIVLLDMNRVASQKRHPMDKDRCGIGHKELPWITHLRDSM